MYIVLSVVEHSSTMLQINHTLLQSYMTYLWEKEVTYSSLGVVVWNSSSRAKQFIEQSSLHT